MNARIEMRRRAHTAEGQPHKYAIGAEVFHVVAHRRERLPFHVVRLMPDGGFGPQYRLRCDDDGHERVVIEKDIEHRVPEGNA